MITITRHHTGFYNVADQYSLGNNEHDGNASTTAYTLPSGYSFDPVCNDIRDPDGCVCAIVQSDDGPQLISLVGKITAQPILVEVTP
jgi:hypothetical protein